MKEREYGEGKSAFERYLAASLLFRNDTVPTRHWLGDILKRTIRFYMVLMHGFKVITYYDISITS